MTPTIDPIAAALAEVIATRDAAVAAVDAWAEARIREALLAELRRLARELDLVAEPALERAAARWREAGPLELARCVDHLRHLAAELRDEERAA